ncbi:hypothetical protein HMPREF1582_00517 [Gardnerella vaginalis JCP8151A]|nr:hypothetical protein HMPREF1582_00517 [Gardnerella vaginalis JCP8151A]
MASKFADVVLFFPDFVRDLGGMWYKVRQLVPLFVRDLGQMWYKMRKSFPQISRVYCDVIVFTIFCDCI